MPIPESILPLIKCCICNDGHMAIDEPIMLKCGGNACKPCIIKSKDASLKCFKCSGEHQKGELLNSPKNEIVESIVKLYFNDIKTDLNSKIEVKRQMLTGKNKIIFIFFKFNMI